MKCAHGFDEASRCKQCKSDNNTLLAQARSVQAENVRLRQAASAVAAMLGDTPRDRLGRLDIVATETRETVRKLAVKYGVRSGDYMDQCAKVLRAALMVKR